MSFLFLVGEGDGDVCMSLDGERGCTYDGLDAVIHLWLNVTLLVFNAADELVHLVLLDDERDLLLVIYRAFFRRHGRLAIRV